MPQCKMSNCREPAVPGRGWGNKRYCQQHGEAYVAKRREHEQKRKSYPDCESGISPQCEGKVSASRQMYGETVCSACEHEAETLNAMQRKEQAFDDAHTVEELKEWIRKYLL